MLNNRKTFERLMALLRSIDPDVPLPVELEEILWNVMIVEKYCFNKRLLEEQGQVPVKAYYVVSGFVKVYAYCPLGYRYLYRIYRENSIVALKCFMDRKESEFEIEACRNTLVWSISADEMAKIYRDLPGMREMALKTALTYSEGMEKLKNDLRAMPIDEGVLRFYTLFKGLLPAKSGPIRDVDVACFLGVTHDMLKASRARLRKMGLIGD